MCRKRKIFFREIYKVFQTSKNIKDHFNINNIGKIIDGKMIDGRKLFYCTNSVKNGILQILPVYNGVT